MTTLKQDRSYEVSDTDLYYSAGLYEGEGCASVFRAYTRKDGTKVYTLKARVTMCDTEPLYRMKEIWGGGVSKDSVPRKENHRQAYAWSIAGARARSFFLKLRELLSPRRQGQIDRVLADPRLVPLVLPRKTASMA